MFTSAEIAILESLSRGGKDLRSTTDPSDLSSLVGVTLDNKAVVNAFTFHRTSIQNKIHPVTVPTVYQKQILAALIIESFKFLPPAVHCH